LAEGYVEVKALGRRGVVYTLGWNYHAFGRTALLLNCVDEARHGGIAAHRFDEIGEANYRKADTCRATVCAGRHIAAGSWQALPTRRQAAAQEHLAIATMMYRSMETIFWLQQTEVESNELGWIPRRAESFSMGKANTISSFRHL
jgi:hypothetical protein